ncbi:MAG: hypothetical protein I8H71_01390 [Xanthomonadaceae bacterium]|nr:hypothetical protein [Xanthomonadaceae bacterium]
MTERELIDPEDGENRAVRMFLALYGMRPSLTVAAMRDHLTFSGFPHWPAWAADDAGHLTKGGAQDWLRHLFALETAALAQPVAASDVQVPNTFKLPGESDEAWVGRITWPAGTPEPVFVYSGQSGRELEDILDGYDFGTAFYTSQPAPQPVAADPEQVPDPFDDRKDAERPETDTQSLAMSGRSVEYINGYERGFESGVDAARAARPTPA